MRHRPLKLTISGISARAISSLRCLSRVSVIQGTTGSGSVVGVGAIGLLRGLSFVGSSFVGSSFVRGADDAAGEACAADCETGPDNGPKLDMRAILATRPAQSQAHNCHEIR